MRDIVPLLIKFYDVKSSDYFYDVNSYSNPFNVGDDINIDTYDNHVYSYYVPSKRMRCCKIMEIKKQINAAGQIYIYIGVNVIEESEN